MTNIRKKLKKYNKLTKKIKKLNKKQQKLAKEIAEYAVLLTDPWHATMYRWQSENANYCRVLKNSKKYAALYKMLDKIYDINPKYSGKPIYEIQTFDDNAETILHITKTDEDLAGKPSDQIEFPLTYLDMSPLEFKGYVNNAAEEVNKEKTKSKNKK